MVLLNISVHQNLFPLSKKMVVIEKKGIYSFYMLDSITTSNKNNYFEWLFRGPSANINFIISDLNHRIAFKFAFNRVLKN